jgi:multiple sugar transport system substrate-binding protein
MARPASTTAIAIAAAGLVMAAATVAYLLADEKPEPGDVPLDPQPAGVRFLLVGDPFAAVLEREAPALLATAGLRPAFERTGYDATRRAILAERAMPTGTFQVVAFDVVWTAELAERGALQPLDAFIARDGIALSDYLPPAIAGVRWNGAIYGLPVQPHAELLWYRRDLLAAAGLAPPRTPDELLAAARALHRPAEGLYGIVWNAQRGSALGQTVAHLYAAHGARLLDDQGRPTLDGAGGRAVARLLRDLVAVSPPDILNTAWDQRRRRFIAGQAALTFEWGARMGEGLLSPDCHIGGKVGCAPPPVAPGVAPVAAFGTWCLGIPASAGSTTPDAWRAIAAVCGADGVRRLAAGGNAGVPLRSLFADDALGSPYAGLFPVMRELDVAGAFTPHVRPATPHWDDLCRLLGEVFHDVLRGELPADEAPGLAQVRALELWGRTPPGAAR